MTGTNLRTEHTFLLRLLEHGDMTASMLSSANFGASCQTKRLLEDLMNMDLIERNWEGDIVKYRRK